MKFKIIYENKINYKFSDDVYLINKILNKYNKKCYAVGGCVRDLFLNKTPHDIDLTTNANPDEIEDIFQKEGYKTIPSGKEFGTISVIVNKEVYEITTFRKEGNYSNNRKPDQIEFISDIKEDLSRRDFTWNAMAIDLTTNELFDPFGGVSDLENHILKTVGDPNDRFSEDYLRMLRAVRFATKFNFKLDDKIKDSMQKLKNGITSLSMERVQKELSNILLTNKPSIGFEIMKETGILKIILPEVDILDSVEQNNKYHTKNVFYHTMDVIDGSKNDLIIRLAALLHDTGKEKAKTTTEKDGVKKDSFIGHEIESAIIARNVMKRLKYSNNVVEKVVKLIELHQVELMPKNVKMKRFLNKVGDDVHNWEELRRADIKAHNPEVVGGHLEHLDKLKSFYNNILDNKHPYAKSHLAINGNDIQKILNIKPGKIINNFLDELLLIVMEHPEFNNKEYLTNWLVKNKERKII